MLFRKKKRPEIIEPPPCKHKWQDFPWYCEFSWGGGEFEVKIIEPYVCIYCKKRQNVELLYNHYLGITEAERLKKIREIKEDFKDRLQPKPIVEDMIHDFQLVDRQWLEIAKALREGHKQ